MFDEVIIMDNDRTQQLYRWIKTQLPYYRHHDGTFSVAKNAYFMIKSIKTLGLLFIDTGDTLTNKGISVASN